jgi:hypothetical protein
MGLQGGNAMRHIRKILLRGIAIALTVVAVPVHAWTEAEKARIAQATAKTVVLLPVDAATGNNITETVTTPQGDVIRTVACLDTNACKEIASQTGLSATLTAQPISLADLLFAAPLAELTFFASMNNARYANSQPAQGALFYVSRPDGAPLVETLGSTSAIQFFTDAPQAMGLRDLARERVGTLETHG